MNYLERLFLYRRKLFSPKVHQLVTWMTRLAYVCSLTFLLAVVCEHGFMISSAEQAMLNTAYRVVWIVMLVSMTVQIIFREEETAYQFTAWTWLLNVALYLTLLPVVFHRPEADSGIEWIWLLFHSEYYRKGVLFLLSLTQLSGSLVLLLGKRTNPPLILASSFFFFILIGSGLLMLPRATYHGISWIDALFTATSATCVTGLSTVDVPSTFTLEGQTIIILLVQIGGLGVMTLTSFFAMFFMGNTSLYNQLVVGDMISSNSLNSLLSTLLYILGFTLVIEGIGAVIIWWSIHGTLGMTFDEEVYFSVFHAVSAFCNAGFSTFDGGVGNPVLMQGHNLLYVTLGLLIALGGIGFPILVNLKDTVCYHLSYLKAKILHPRRPFLRKVHLYNLNTKIVLVMTALLLVVGTLLIALVEWNHALAGMPMLDKWVHAFFNSSCPRSGGFVSVSLSAFSRQTLLLILVLMMIGGGTQSTAGGVKINVFAVILINLWTVIRGSEHAVILNRELSHDSIRRSNAALISYFVLLFPAVFLLCFLEPEAPLLSIAFECVSALSTAGLTLNLTPLLGTPGKLLIICLMFIGRVGTFTLIAGLVKQEKKRNYKYPSDNIIIT